MRFTFNKRSAPRRGPSASDAWNDSFEELQVDLASLQTEWNSKLVKIIVGLPNGSDDTGINAFVNGLDGNNCYVDTAASSTSTVLTYYDATNDRPYTVREALDALHTRITAVLADLQEMIADEAAALTDGEKAAIGWSIFDPAKVSSPTSLVGKCENNRLNVIQIAKDLYGSAYYTLDNDGQANLTYSVQAAVDALLQIHNGSWDSDVVVDHTGIPIVVTQASINSSAPGDDGFAGVPLNLEEDLDQLRTAIGYIKGTATWLTGLTPLYAGGADDLEGLLVNTHGTGVKSATNPWGYDAMDIGGFLTISGTLICSGVEIEGNGSIGGVGRIELADDVEITDSTNGLVLRDPAGGRWRITVDIAGGLSTTHL